MLQSQQTLKDKFAQIVPKRHVEFLSRLKLSYWYKDLFFVHAGVDPARRLADQLEQDLLWIRSEFLNYQNDFGATIVHGHTPSDVVEYHSNRVNIDTGAAYGRKLSAVVFEGDEIFELTPNGRAKINPITGAG